MSGAKETALAVDGQGLYFYFDRKKRIPVLNDANIAVTRGTIYSLLGPSGCGKTTLLKCIVGQHKVQEGSLKVYGRIPGSKGFSIPGRGAGYMPQDLGLYFEMTIEEIMVFFGSLYGMNRQLIKERLNFLIELLALPEKKRMIKCLSGGQQRRVSFAIALIHKPPLLILDEPTVGVDPLLRQIIWDHLITLARNEYLTIIITTHYTEEARQANIVGLMRNGHLVAERNPDDLMKEHGVITLEEVFLKLCQNRSDDDQEYGRSHSLATVESLDQKSLKKNGAVLNENEYNERHAIAMDDVNKYDGGFEEVNGGQDNTSALLSKSPLPKELNYSTSTSELSASLHRVSSLTKKNFLRLKRNIFMMIFSLITPTLEVVIFCLYLGSNPFGLHVAVVNMDEDINRYGDKLLLSVNNRTIYQQKYENFSAAYESVKNGKTFGALYIGPEFSSCLVDRILEGADASNDTLMCSLIKLYIDKSNHVIATTIYSELMKAYQQFATLLFVEYEKSPILAVPPISIEDYVYGSPSTTVMEFIAPALILGVAYMISIGMTSMSLMEENKLGLFERSFIAGATSVEVLTSFFLALLVILIGQVMLMLTCAFFIFNIPCNGPLFWITIGVMLVGIDGMAYGFFIATVTSDVATGGIIALASFFPTVLLSGMIWPVEAIPFYLRWFSYCLPLTKMNESMRSLITRGWSVEDNYTWDGYMICNLWTIILLVLSVILFKFKK